MGGGMGIAQGSTLRIVGERTRIAMPEVAIGFFPDVGASYFLSRLPGALGIYLALTGIQIRGVDALYCQLADVYLPPPAIESLTDDLAALNWSEDPAGRLAAIHSCPRRPGTARTVAQPAASRHRRAFLSAHRAGHPGFPGGGDAPGICRLGAAVRQAHAQPLSDHAVCHAAPTAARQGFEPRRLLSHGTRHGAANASSRATLSKGVRALIIDKDNAPQLEARPDRRSDRRHDRRLFPQSVERCRASLRNLRKPMRTHPCS